MRGQPIATLQRQQTAVSRDAPGKPSSISSRRRASLSGACASSSSQASGWPGGYLPGKKCEDRAACDAVTEWQLSGLAASISNKQCLASHHSRLHAPLHAHLRPAAAAASCAAAAADVSTRPTPSRLSASTSMRSGTSSTSCRVVGDAPGISAA